MRLSVSDGDLRAVLRRFKPRRNAQLRVEFSGSAVDVIGNAEGYLTLARWCLVMAHPDMQQIHPRWLYSLLRLSDASQGQEFASVAFKPDDQEVEIPLKNVRFFRVAGESAQATSQG